MGRKGQNKNYENKDFALKYLVDFTSNLKKKSSSLCTQCLIMQNTHLHHLRTHIAEAAVCDGQAVTPGSVLHI